MRHKILTVDDAKTVRIIIKKSFRNFDCEIIEAANGVEGLAMADKTMPDLILLDLNMPRMDGREVLAEIVADKTLVGMPVVVLTTSTEDEEILKMYNLRCSSYIIKPIDFAQFLRAVGLLAEYWFTVVVLPTGTSG